MKIKRIILITSLILLVLNFNIFATESGDIILDTPDINVEENINNNDSQEENTNTGNENSGENSNTEADNNQTENNNNIGSGNNESNNEIENNTNNNIGSDNNESTDNSNQIENNTDNNAGSSSNESTNNNVGTDNNVPNDNNNQTNNNEQIPNEDINEPVEQPPVENEEPPVSEPIVSDPINNNTVIETKSENANLRMLNLDVEGISPEFDKDITEYYLIVDLSVEEIDIEAYPEDEKAIILLIEGNTELKEGQNTIRIVVRAEAGNTKTYIINVTKTDDAELANANLKNLSVKGFNFYPSFKNNIYGYTLTINENVSQLEIIVEPENEAATYEIIGNENLNEGDNLIKVIVTAQDGETKREYKINVFMDSKKVQIQETSNLPAIILLSFIGIAIIGTSIALSKKH